MSFHLPFVPIRMQQKKTAVGERRHEVDNAISPLAIGKRVCAAVSCGVGLLQPRVRALETNDVHGYDCALVRKEGIQVCFGKFHDHLSPVPQETI